MINSKLLSQVSIFDSCAITKNTIGIPAIGRIAIVPVHSSISVHFISQKATLIIPLVVSTIGPISITVDC